MRHKQSEIAYYAIAMSFQRVAPIVVIPVVSRLAGVDGLGEYTIASVVVYLLAPMISLGGVTPIAREGAESSSAGRFALLAFQAVAGAVTALLLMTIAVATTGDTGMAASAIVCSAAMESSFQMLLATLRAEGRHRLYLAASGLRGGALVGGPILLVTFFQSGSTVPNILFSQAAATGFAGLAVWFALPIIGMKSGTRASFRRMLSYSLPVIPHNAAMWAMSASGRLVVYLMSGAAAAGYFGAVSAIASICALVNLTAATVVPRLTIQDYEKWISRDHKSFVALGCISIYLVFFCTAFMSFLDANYFGAFTTYFEGYFLSLSLLSAAFVIALPHVFYLNLFVRARRTSAVSVYTLFSLLISFPVFWMLTWKFGVVGAAWANLASQIVNSGLIGLMASNLEPRVKQSYAFVLAAVTVATGGLLVSGAILDTYASLPSL